MIIFMSMDNYILINRKTFEVKEICASDGEIHRIIKKCKSLDEAVDIASKEAKEGESNMGFGLESNKNVKLTGEENIVDGVLLRNFDFFEFFSICISFGFVAVVGTRRVW